MRHEYYGYDKEALLENPRIKLLCMKDNDAVFRQMAGQMAQEIKSHNAREERTVFICPVGPVGQYPYFVGMVNEENISLKNVWFINMDEYLDEEKRWISKDHPLSFRGFMDRNVYSRIRPELLMPEDQRIFPDPDDLTYIPVLIERLGGVDMVFGGIGINGHVAFNEADGTLSQEEFLAQKTRVLKISPETRAANAIGDFNGALEDMPSYCVTVGIHEIAHAGKIRLGCFRNWHRAVVRRAGYGQPTPEFPVSLLQNHPDITLTFTEYVAALTD
ncbi:sugar phosphate isomerase family [Lacrimispora brassicae]